MKDLLENNFNFKNIVKSTIVIYIFFSSYIFNLIPIYLFNLDINNISLKTSSYIMLFSYIVVLLILLGIYFKDIINEFKLFIKNIWKNFDVGLKSWLLGLSIMFFSNLVLVFIFKSSGANNENAVQSLIKASPIAMGFYTCLFAPIIEEFVFRKTLKDIIKNKWLFIFISFIFFGGAHVISSAQNIIDLLYIIPYGAFGITFAYAYYKTDTIYTSILFHMIHNSLLFFLSIII
jgi:membrane protease YdiL (CAAX protease family)